MSVTSVDFPDPDTPVTATNSAERERRPRGLLRLCWRAPQTRSARSAVATRRRARHRDAQLAAQVARGERIAVAQDRIEPAHRDDLAPVAPRPRTQVDDVVGGADRLLVVLDHQHRVAEVAQLAQASSSRRALSRWCSPIEGSSRM